MNSIYVAGQRKGRKYQSDLEKRRGQIWTTPAPVSTVFTPTIRTPLLQWWQMVRNALVCLFFFGISVSFCHSLPLRVSPCLSLSLSLSRSVSLCLCLSLRIREPRPPIVTMMLNGRNTLSLFLYLYLSWSLNLCLCHSLTLLSFSMVVLIYD